MKPLFSLVFCAFMGLPALATSKDCTDFHVRYGSFHYQRHASSDGSCTLMVDPFDVHDFVYRSYLISNRGLLMVFNSYDPGEESSSTGARVFHFFPRKNLPDLVASEKEVSVKLPSPGMEMIFSQEFERILRMTGAIVKEDPKVESSNKGGVDISKVKTLFLDSGFAMGHDVTSEANRASTFYDVKGRSCSVLNKEIFRYTSDGDSDFKFTDSELKTFLKSRCPRLSVNF